MSSDRRFSQGNGSSLFPPQSDGGDAGNSSHRRPSLVLSFSDGDKATERTIVVDTDTGSYSPFGQMERPAAREDGSLLSPTYVSRRKSLDSQPQQQNQCSTEDEAEYRDYHARRQDQLKSLGLTMADARKYYANLVGSKVNVTLVEKFGGDLASARQDVVMAESDMNSLPDELRRELFEEVERSNAATTTTTTTAGNSSTAVVSTRSNQYRSYDQ